MSAQDAYFSGVADTSGTCVIDITTGARVRDWVVSQVSVEMAGAVVGTARCIIRKNGALIAPVRPDIDNASGEPPVTVNAADHLTVTWTSVPVGAIGKVFLIYDDGR